jgi:high-affinity iron transporter
MLPTFVIGLREGLEAALIVGIIAAFLRKQGRRDLVRWVGLGVGVAVLVCLAVGLGLEAASQALPQKQQEGLETVIGVVAVAMVTYMVVWMRRHSRQLKGQLETMAAGALADGRGVGGLGAGARAMVLMAFLAVIREGFETVVFLLAAFNESGSGAAAGAGAVLGLAVAIALGWGIYRGGVRLNLSRFFRATGLVLVLVAAGLVVNALHTAHEAGWLDAGQGRTLDLSGLVQPGSVQASLLTGMLGIQPRPVTIEVIGWLLYLVPVGLYVVWPPGRRLASRPLAATTLVVAVLAATASITTVLTAPTRPARSAAVLSADASSAVIRTGTGSEPLTATGTTRTAGVDVTVYRSAADTTTAARSLTTAAAARANGGRLPLGVRAGADGTLAATLRTSSVLVAGIERSTGHLVTLERVRTVTAQVSTATGPVPLAQPVQVTRTPSVASDAAGARQAVADLDAADAAETRAAWFTALALLALAVAAGAVVAERRRPAPAPAPVPPATPVRWDRAAVAAR